MSALAEQSGAGPQTILLVDDLQPNLVSFEAALEPLGYRLVFAESGRVALQTLLEHAVSLIVLDVRMPEIDGLELASLIRQREKSRSTPIIFVTADHDAVDRISTIEGARCLLRPVDPRVLRMTVAACMNELREMGTRSEVAAASATTPPPDYRFLAECVPQQVWTATADGRLDYVNPVVESYFAKPAQEILGDGWLSVLHSEDTSLAIERWTRSLASGEGYEIEFRLRRSDGMYRWHLGRATAETTAAGTIARWVGTNTDIHDRKALESELRGQQIALRANEERLRLALAAGGLGEWEFDTKNNLVRASAEVERLHGLDPRGERPVDDFIACVCDEDREKILEATARMRSGQVAIDMRYRIRTTAGQRWLEIRGRAVADSQRVVGVCADVTERIQRDELERERLHEWFMQVPAAIGVVSGPDHRFDLANPHYLRLAGRDNLVGMTLVEAFPEVRGQGFDALLDQVRSSGEPFVGREVAAKLANKAGVLEDIIVDFVYQPMVVGGRQTGIMIVAFEVTQQVLARRRLEEALALAERSERRFQLLAETMPQIMWWMSPDLSEYYLNPRWYEYTKQRPDDTVATRWLASIHPEDYETHMRSWTAARDTGEPWEFEYRLRRADGVYRWHLGRSAPDRQPDGTIARWYGTATDIHEQRSAILSRDSLLATVSHDLRDPLAAIGMAGELLHANPNEQARQSGQRIHRNVARMEQLVQDLLDISAIESGKLSLTKVNHDLREIVEEAVATAEPRAAANGIRIEMQLPAERASALCDRLRILQVLGNLLSNAIKFCPARGIIGVHLVPEGDTITCAVSDNGPGIAAEDVSSVFDRFWRAKNQVKPGTGIGLAIAQGIVVQHGGRIGVESEAGHGARFWFSIPRSDSSESA